jgi:hypothetical protein
MKRSGERGAWVMNKGVVEEVELQRDLSLRRLP